ncbi:MAG: hypothetical protein ACRDZ2_09920 [Ilumatobacteraceae bacterium]
MDANLDLIAVNVSSTVHLAKCLLADMVARGEGRVPFTSSAAAPRCLGRATPRRPRRRHSPADVAHDGFEALMAGKDHVVAGAVRNRLQSGLAKVLAETVTPQCTTPRQSRGDTD